MVNKSMQMVIDLTQPINEGMPVFPGDPEVKITPYLYLEQGGCRVSSWAMGSHTGTHMDAPSHFIDQGLSLDRYDVSRFQGRGVVVNATSLTAGETIGRQHLADALALANPGEFIVINTGWSRYWGQPIYDQHPHLSLEGAGMLVDHYISLVAIDCPDIEKATEEDYAVHQLLLLKDCLIVENLTNLEWIHEPVGLFTFLPLPVKGADGSPIRALYQPLTSP